MSHPTKHMLRALEELLEDVSEFLSSQIDVVDGDYGEPEPNKAMQLSNAIEYAMGRRPGP